MRHTCGKCAGICKYFDTLSESDEVWHKVSSPTKASEQSQFVRSTWVHGCKATKWSLPAKLHCPKVFSTVTGRAVRKYASHYVRTYEVSDMHACSGKSDDRGGRMRDPKCHNKATRSRWSTSCVMYFLEIPNGPNCYGTKIICYILGCYSNNCPTLYHLQVRHRIGQVCLNFVWRSAASWLKQRQKRKFLNDPNRSWTSVMFSWENSEPVARMLSAWILMMLFSRVGSKRSDINEQAFLNSTPVACSSSSPQESATVFCVLIAEKVHNVPLRDPKYSATCPIETFTISMSVCPRGVKCQVSYKHLVDVGKWDGWL